MIKIPQIHIIFTQNLLILLFCVKVTNLYYKKFQKCHRKTTILSQIINKKSGWQNHPPKIRSKFIIMQELSPHRNQDALCLEHKRRHRYYKFAQLAVGQVAVLLLQHTFLPRALCCVQFL